MTVPRTAGSWRVEVYIPGRYGASHAGYGVSSAARTTSASVNQSGYGEIWVALGTVHLGTGGRVTLSNTSGQSGDCSTQQNLNAAAVRWIYQG